MLFPLLAAVSGMSERLFSALWCTHPGVALPGCVGSIFNWWRNCQAVSGSGRTVLHSHSSAREIQFLPVFTNTYFLGLFSFPLHSFLLCFHCRVFSFFWGNCPGGHSPSSILKCRVGDLPPLCWGS